MKSILVVDDMASNVRLISRVLAGTGWRIEGAASAEEALTFAAREMPDLVLMDLRLPSGMTGYEAVRKLRELPGGRSAVVVALSASPTLTDGEKIRSAGFDGFIMKPFEVAELPSALASYLSQGRDL